MNRSDVYTALILAAGIGSRISELTTEPKCLLKINNKTILELHLEALIFSGIVKVVIVTGYKERLIREVALLFTDKLEIQFIYNNYYDSRGNTYSLLCGLNSIQAPLLIFDADLIYDKNILNDFISVDVNSQVLVGRCSLDDIECSKVLIDSQKNIRQFADKRKVTVAELTKYRLAGEAIGILKFSKEYALELTQECNIFLSASKNLNSNWESFLNFFVEDHNLNIHATINSNWIEVDTKLDYENAINIFA